MDIFEGSINLIWTIHAHASYLKLSIKFQLVFGAEFIECPVYHSDLIHFDFVTLNHVTCGASNFILLVIYGKKACCT